MKKLTEANYYKRQIILPEVGEEGQKKLNDAKVLVIGAGGLGSPLLNYLTSGGIGEIHIYDFDSVEESNLNRQNLFSPVDIGSNKAITAAKILSKKNPLIKIIGHDKKFSESIDLNGFNWVIDCTDNFQSKYLAHDLCYIKDVNFSVASIHKFEGQVQLFTNGQKENSQPCLRCLWENRPSDDCVQTCAEAGVIGAVAGVIGTIQAMEIIKSIVGLPYLSNSETLFVNLLDFQSFKIKHPKKKDCVLCSKENPTPIKDRNPMEVSWEEALEKNYTLFNMTEKTLNNLTTQKIESDLTNLSIQKNEEFAVFCQKGISSLRKVASLREMGFEKAFSIQGGINAFPSTQK